MVFVVIITFAISWLPLYTIFCFVKFAGDLIYDESGTFAVGLLLKLSSLFFIYFGFWSILKFTMKL